MNLTLGGDQIILVYVYIKKKSQCISLLFPNQVGLGLDSCTAFLCHLKNDRGLVSHTSTHSEELSLCVTKVFVISFRVKSIAVVAAAGLEAQGFVMLSRWAGTT